MIELLPFGTLTALTPFQFGLASLISLILLSAEHLRKRLDEFTWKPKSFIDARVFEEFEFIPRSFIDSRYFEEFWMPRINDPLDPVFIEYSWDWEA